VLGGIYSGYFAVSEAAAVTALYVLILYLIIRREIKLVEMPRIMRESMVLVGGILMILGVSIASTSLMIDLEVPQKLLAAINSYVGGQVSFLLLMLLFLLVLGAILDIFSALVLIVPLLLPIAESYGIHPLHFGIIFLATMELGYLTPPVGLNLFISSYRFEKPITSVYLATIPFFLILLLSVLVITFVPQLSLWLVPD
ncbi:MAG: TRAP transporter large permease subunit, partial [Proteobacteria bacterium]|nr:TRAP transporter large permease subunit [Pseudomonadota bacterium]